MEKISKYSIKRDNKIVLYDIEDLDFILKVYYTLLKEEKNSFIWYDLTEDIYDNDVLYASIDRISARAKGKEIEI